jgi:hypothetical protein
MPGEWDPARVAQLVAVAGVLVHACWVRRWNARRVLRGAIRTVEADVRADVVEGYLSARSAGYVTLRSRLVRLRERPSRAVHLLTGAPGRRGEPPGSSFPVGECPAGDRPRLAAYATALDDAVRDYVSAAHPLAWWQLRRGRPVRRLDLGRTRPPAAVVRPAATTVQPAAERAVRPIRPLPPSRPARTIRLPEPTVPRP